ncbi:MAG: hypothetical protein HQK97_11505 [Nitrospirae bacterium]|nr:hypothetical protein [Nitrospirota bacterium]
MAKLPSDLKRLVGIPVIIKPLAHGQRSAVTLWVQIPYKWYCDTHKSADLQKKTSVNKGFSLA